MFRTSAVDSQQRTRSQLVRRVSGTTASGPQEASFLVSDCGDEHEMTGDFGESLARAGERLAGFVVGVGFLMLAWAIWLLT
jgi:hypothetical protein